MAALEACAFSPDALRALLGRSTAVEYLAEYLTALGVTSILIEPHYVDRHYLDDFARYYSRSFRAPVPHCERLHFFCGIDHSTLDAAIDAAVLTEALRTTGEARLAEHYGGFVVKRPLDGPAMGRTVLRTYPVDGRRHYTVVRPYRVHLAGMQLGVDGLAYQQQDGGAAVCASTSLWSALQRVAYVAGHRTPTPSQITEAAQSPYPASHGLDMVQMANALSTLGYIADEFPARDPALFRAQVVSCLDSQLPVVLLLERETSAHAVTLTGYSDAAASAVTISAKQPVLHMKGATASVLYVHDDNLGSHAHYELFDHVVAGNTSIALRRGRTVGGNRPWWTADEWLVVGALVPKPSKLRLPLEGLFSMMLRLRSAIEHVVLPGIALTYAPHFCAGIDYVKKAIAMPLSASQRAPFFRALSLPRHIGVVGAFLMDQHVIDCVVDASSIIHGGSAQALLAFVAPGMPRASHAGVNLHAFADRLGVACITAD